MIRPTARTDTRSQFRHVVEWRGFCLCAAGALCPELEAHVGVYNGKGYGRAEIDKYKGVQGRATATVFSHNGGRSRVQVSGFYSYGRYAKDRPRNLGLVMASYESRHVVVTGQYATDNPFVVADVERQGFSFFGETRMGVTGWAALGRIDFFNPDADRENDNERRYIVGGAHWSQLAHGRYDYVVPFTLWDGIGDQVPNAHLHLFERSGHQPFFEEPARFAEVALAWMARCAATRQG